MTAGSSSSIARISAPSSRLDLDRAQERGGRLLQATHTAPDYRLFALPGTVPPKPGLVRAAAGEGEAVELAARPLWVESLDLLGTTPDTADLRMVCGKGGYVRSIARDLGRALGCLGHVAQLRRIWSGPFDAGQGIALDRIDRANQAEIDKIVQMNSDASSTYDIPGTPTFLVNGEEVKPTAGQGNWQALEAAIKAAQ